MANWRTAFADIAAAFVVLAAGVFVGDFAHVSCCDVWNDQTRSYETAFYRWPAVFLVFAVLYLLMFSSVILKKRVFLRFVTCLAGAITLVSIVRYPLSGYYPFAGFAGYMGRELLGLLLFANIPVFVSTLAFLIYAKFLRQQ